MTAGGDVANSKLFASNGNVGVTIEGNVVASHFTGSSVAATISGNLTGSQIESLVSQVAVSVGKNANATEITSRGTMLAAFSANALNMVVSAAGQTDFLVNGNFKGAIVNTQDTLSLVAIGNVLPGTQIIASDAARIHAEAFAGTLSAGTLDLRTTGSVLASARIQAAEIADISGDGNAFSIGGDFGGRLTVHGDFASGDDASTTLVEGTVLPTARITIGGSINGTTDYVFANAFLGALFIGGDINQDIDFGGNVKSIFVGGSINADLTVIGKVASIVAGNLFIATDDNDGTFRDGAGNITGALDTTLGFGKVISAV